MANLPAETQGIRLSNLLLEAKAILQPPPTVNIKDLTIENDAAKVMLYLDPELDYPPQLCCDKHNNNKSLLRVRALDMYHLRNVILTVKFPSFMRALALAHRRGLSELDRQGFNKFTGILYVEMSKPNQRYYVWNCWISQRSEPRLVSLFNLGELSRPWWSYEIRYGYLCV